MKVLSFSSCFPSSIDPNKGIFVLHRLCALSKYADVEAVHPVGWFPFYRGHRCMPSHKQEKIQGLTVHHPRFFYVPGILKRLDGWIYGRGVSPWLAGYLEAHGRPDLLDAHFAWPDGVGVCYLARRFDIPYTITLRGTVNSRYRKPAFRKRMSEALRNASAIISVSKPMAEIAVELGADPTKLHLIPNGVHLATFSPLPAAEARRMLGLDQRRRYIIAVTNILPSKGLSELVDTLASLPDDVHLLVVGGDGNNGNYRMSLQRRASAGGYGGRLVFVGSQPHDRVPLYLNAGDVSVLASYAEGCPNVVIESLACGRPVVATGVGEVPRLVVPDVSGFIIPPGDRQALASALKQALDRSWSPEDIRSTSAVRSWDSVAKRIVPVLEEAVASSR